MTTAKRTTRMNIKLGPGRQWPPCSPPPFLRLWFQISLDFWYSYRVNRLLTGQPKGAKVIIPYSKTVANTGVGGG